ncbi:hypothetical protein [Spirillospora albida]|uniref:hypothetical protein n=1 Tax=Spirillospora albida TaxID=58123 RepID=UPI0012FA4CB6|nr:hypothetical protein [Spirillospora albida]
METNPVSAGAQTVQARAEPVAVEWNMGENRIRCDNAGSRNGKTCGYTYRRSSAGQSGSGSYKITATIIWNVTWQCQGADCTAPQGALPPMVMTSPPTPLIVSEIQTNTDQ